MTMEKKEQYKNVFKSTFLFSLVQVVRILVGLIKNKVIAILLGSEGLGIISIFQNTLNFIKTGAGLGISQSAVKDISEANASGDKNTISRIISIVLKVVLFTSFLGAIITIVLSPFLSRWGFGDNHYTFSFILLSIAIFFEIFVENQLAILKGLRHLRALAKASIFGSIIGLLTGVPLYYLFGVKGIVPSFIVTAISIFSVTRYYIKKDRYAKIDISMGQALVEASPMIKMGVSLMLVSLIGTFFSLFIAAYVRSHGGLSIVGFYNAGDIIVTSYIGVIITAMSTDYYPRISAVHNDNNKLAEEVNIQSEVGLMMAFPLVVIFILFSPFLIQILYSAEFIVSIKYTDYAIIGSVITICSNCMGMILLAKQASSIFVISVLGQRLLCLLAYVLLYNQFGLQGLGYAYIFMAVLHICLMSIIMHKFYNIKFRLKVILQLLMVISTILFCFWVRNINNIYIKYTICFVLICSTSLYSLTYIKKYMGIDIITVMKNRIKNKI